MYEQEELPPFTVVAIVCMLLITVPSDIATAAADLALGIPYLGEITFALDKVLGAIAWVIVQFWFVMQLRTFGKSGIAILIGGLLEELGIPAMTIATMAAVWMANHPEAGGAARAIAEKAAAKATLARGAKGAPGAAKTAQQPRVVGAGVRAARETQPGETLGGAGAGPGGAETKAGARPSEIETGVKPSEAPSAGSGQASVPLPEEGGEQKMPAVSEEQLGALQGPFEQAQEEAGLTEKLPGPEKKGDSAKKTNESKEDLPKAP